MLIKMIGYKQIGVNQARHGRDEVFFRLVKKDGKMINASFFLKHGKGIGWVRDNFPELRERVKQDNSFNRITVFT